MKHPLRLIIHVPLREKRDFRQTLVGLRHSLSVALVGPICVYDLMPAIKPRKGQEHLLIGQLAEQLEEGWTLAVWDLDRLLSDLARIVAQLRHERPKLALKVEAAWDKVSSADEEQLIDLKWFQKFPNGHYVGMIAARQNFDPANYPPRLRRRLMAYRSKARPASEDFWGVLHPLIMTKLEAEEAWAAYRRWVGNNRPRPPRHDLDNVSNDQKADRDGRSEGG